MQDLIKQVQEACAQAAFMAADNGIVTAAAIRALDLSHLTGWQPIGTAPKDGTVIILFGNGRVTAGHWEPEKWPVAAEYCGKTGEYLGQYETGECIPAWWYSEDGGFADDSPPTHWMPLPTPPRDD